MKKNTTHHSQRGIAGKSKEMAFYSHLTQDDRVKKIGNMLLGKTAEQVNGQFVEISAKEQYRRITLAWEYLERYHDYWMDDFSRMLLQKLGNNVSVFGEKARPLTEGQSLALAKILVRNYAEVAKKIDNTQTSGV